MVVDGMPKREIRDGSQRRRHLGRAAQGPDESTCLVNFCGSTTPCLSPDPPQRERDTRAPPLHHQPRGKPPDDPSHVMHEPPVPPSRQAAVHLQRIPVSRPCLSRAGWAQAGLERSRKQPPARVATGLLRCCGYLTDRSPHRGVQLSRARPRNDAWDTITDRRFPVQCACSRRSHGCDSTSAGGKAQAAQVSRSGVADDDWMVSGELTALTTRMERLNHIL